MPVMFGSGSSNHSKNKNPRNIASPSIIQKAANNFRNHFNMAFRNITLKLLRKYRELLCRSIKPLILSASNYQSAAG